MRSVLEKIRDVTLIVMAVLVSAVCVVVLFFTVAAGSAIAELGKPDPTPAPAEVIPTNSAGEECVGEVPPPGC